MLKILLSYFLSLLLLASAVAHIFMPEFYSALIPDFIPELLANILSALAEAVIGIALLLKPYRHYGALGFSLLMIGFLPVHIWDLVREQSALGPSPTPEIRLVVQFFLIYLGWWLYKHFKAEV